MPSIAEESVGKITGGSETTIEEYPYQLNFRTYGKHMCGAVVVTTIRALTAAHCGNPDLAPSRYSIKAGSTYRLDEDDTEGNAQIRVISRFFQHPQYDDTTIQNDVAVLYFEEPLIFGASVQPIALPEVNYQVPIGVMATTTGWGITKVTGAWSKRLRFVETPILSNEVCNRSYPGFVTEDMICAGIPEGGRGFCNGDSGGGMVVRGTLIGLISWGVCAMPEYYPSVYARVPYFIPWIRQNM